MLKICPKWHRKCFGHIFPRPPVKLGRFLREFTISVSVQDNVCQSHCIYLHILYMLASRWDSGGTPLRVTLTPNFLGLRHGSGYRSYSLHTSQYILQTVQSTAPYILYSALYKHHSTDCKLITVHTTQATTQCKMQTGHCTLNTAHCTQNTLHCTLNTAPCTLNTAH